MEATAKQLVALFDEMDESGVALEKLRLAVRAPGHDVFDHFTSQETFRRFRNFTPEIGLDRWLRHWFGGSIMTPHKSFGAQEARLVDFMDIAETYEQTLDPDQLREAV